MGQYVTVMGKEKKKQELKKHAATIHCSNTLSLLQRKVTNALLYHAYPELAQKEEHEITVKQLCRLIGYHGNNHAVIKEALRALISTIIEWNIVNDETGNENWTASTIIASVSLEGPLCYYAYSPRMKQLLHSPSMFGKIDLVIQSHFRSSYGLALYENCIRYRGLPYTKWFEIDLFKKLMGVPAGKYGIFRDFKRRVLDKAVDEVNTYSDLTIAAELIREGRKVKRIRFSLKDRAKKLRLGGKVARKSQIAKSDLSSKLQDIFGLSVEQMEVLFATYEESFIKEKVKSIETTKQFKEGHIDNLAGYLLSALKYDYQFKSQKLLPMPIPLEDVRTLHENREVQRKVEQIRNDYREYREQYILQFIEELPIEKKTDFYSRFKAAVEPHVRTILKLQSKRYTRDNVYDSPQIKAQFRHFALRELDLLTIIPIEEYVAGLSTEEKEAWYQLKSRDPDHELLVLKQE